MFICNFRSFSRSVFTLLLAVGLTAAHAHSGKARFHAVIDTDGQQQRENRS